MWNSNSLYSLEANIILTAVLKIFIDKDNGKVLSFCLKPRTSAYIKLSKLETFATFDNIQPELKIPLECYGDGVADCIQIAFLDKHFSLLIQIEQAVQVVINFSQIYADLKRRFTQIGVYLLTD